MNPLIKTDNFEINISMLARNDCWSEIHFYIFIALCSLCLVSPSLQKWDFVRFSRDCFISFCLFLQPGPSPGRGQGQRPFFEHNRGRIIFSQDTAPGNYPVKQRLLVAPDSDHKNEFFQTLYTQDVKNGQKPSATILSTRPSPSTWSNLQICVYHAPHLYIIPLYRSDSLITLLT